MIGTRTALVADDDSVVRAILARQLQDLGFEAVETAADGNEARHMLKEQGPFDLMVCDLRMPGADGVQLMGDLEAAHAETALILISAVGAKVLRASEALARARHLNLLGSLPKPVNLDALRGLLGQAPRKTSGPGASGWDGQLPAGALRAALDADEIRIEVQPQIDLQTDRLIGAEALARWTHTELGRVPPDVFIPLAEDVGLMEELTGRVMRQALAAARRWRELGLVTRIAVNLAPSAFESTALPEELSAMAAHFGVPAGQVVLEATETSLIEDFTGTLDVMTRLRIRGFHLSIDDFGTGHSSLKRLSQIPFSELKVDRSFVGVCASDEEARSIVESTLHMARQLKLKTVAEGVETLEVLTLLRELGCHLAQGWFIGRPIAPADLPYWAVRH